MRQLGLKFKLIKNIFEGIFYIVVTIFNFLLVPGAIFLTLTLASMSSGEVKSASLEDLKSKNNKLVNNVTKSLLIILFEDPTAPRN